MDVIHMYYIEDMTNQLALRPSCPNCGTFYEVRTRPTATEAWQGTWYDHPTVASDICRVRFASELLSSPAQRQAWAEMGSILL